MTQNPLGDLPPLTTSGVNLSDRLKDKRDSDHTLNSGPSRPSYVQTGMLWADSTTADYLINQFDGSDDIPIWQIDVTNNVARIAMDADADSWITAARDDEIDVILGGVTVATFTANGLTINGNIVVSGSGVGVPIGSIIDHAALTPPPGFLECDGSAVSRTTYANLFAVIGTVWGTGDGTTTFNLPDLRGEFRRGWDNGRNLDAGRGFASVQLDQNKLHTHDAGTLSTDNSGNHNHSYRTPNRANGLGGNAYTATWNDLIDTSYDTGNDGNHSHDVNGNTGSEGGSETRVRNVAVLSCIKF